MLTSILIPCYNASRWVAATLESALAQQDTPCEVILVDDGSDDESLHIARRYEARGVRIISQDNAGASAARNRALREARGDFIQFLDADDLLSSGKIAAQLAMLETCPPGTLATCSWGRFAKNPAHANFVDEAVFRDFAPLDFLLLGAKSGAMMHPSAWLVPRKVAERAGPWNESLSLNDDGEYFCRVVLASAGIAFCKKPDARSYYRSGLSGSLSRQRGQRARASQFRSLELIGGHLLAAEDSARSRHAIAGQWRRFVHDFYPAPANLIAEAEARAESLDGAKLGPPPMGPKTAALARLIGWRNTWRLKYLLQR
jgi:glycosyltransferase involved in cell wall biosynthesis